MTHKDIFLKIGYNTMVQIGGKVIAVVLSLVTVGLLTRYLGTSGYGNFTLVFAYLAFFSVIADVGLQITIIKEISQKRQTVEKIYTTFFWLKLLLIFLSSLLAFVFLLFMPYTVLQKTGIIIGIFAVGLSGITTFGTAILQARVRLDIISYIDIVSRIVNTFFIILFINFHLNFYAIVFTVLLGNCAGIFIMTFVLRDIVVLRFSFDKKYARYLMLTTLPIGLSLFFSTVYFKIDTVLLSLYRSAHDVGIYSLSYKVLENILTVWSFYMASLYPILAKYTETKNQKNVKKLMKISIYLLVLLSTGIIIAVYTLAPFIISLLGSRNFSQSILPLRILIFSVPLFFLNNLLYFYNLTKDKQKILFFALLFSLLVNVVLNLYAIPKFGYIGASYTTIITEFLLTIFYTLLLW